jgi:hypothetical protein
MLAVLPDGLPADLSPDFFNVNPWPISDTDFFGECGGVLDGVIGVIQDETPAVADVVLADIRFVLALLDRVHINAAINLMGTASADVTPHDARRRVVQIQGKDISLNLGQGNQTENYKAWIRAGYQMFSCPISFRGGVRHSSAADWWELRKAFPSLVAIKRKAVDRKNDRVLQVGFGNPTDELRRRYCEENQIQLLWLEQTIQLASVHRGRVPSHEALYSALQKVSEEFSHLPAVYRRGIDFQSTWKEWEARLIALWGQYWRYRKNVGQIEATIHLCGAGNVNRRLLALAWQRESAKVLSYNHGGNLHLAEQKYYFLLQEAPWTEIVCPTQQIAENMQETYQNLSMGENYSPLITRHLKEGACKSTSATPRQAESNGSSRCTNRVLIVGFPAHAKRYLYGSGLFFYFRLDLELQTAAHLLASGYEVAYSVHPEYTGVIEPYFQKIGARVVIESFELVCRDYDFLVFTDTASTAFGNAIKGSQNIVLFCQARGGLRERAFCALCKRVGVVPLYWNDEKRLIFDPAQLDSAIENVSHKRFNEEFRTNYIGSPAYAAS